MNVTRDVINDLLPAYFSGEACADTRRLVEDYFRQDVEFEKEARNAAAALESFGHLEAGQPDPRIESLALRRAKRLLRIRMILAALASTFSLNAISLGFSFEVANGRTRVHWLTLPGQKEAILIVIALAVITWACYFRVRHRIRTRILG
ncbi:MAG TPA: hypothetical protein VFO39_13355 [Candidatus Sulfotelmatobacter sp.]|nr:hypothetical protein [Candidatus Sulfotelmatobacter sp.]